MEEFMYKYPWYIKKANSIARKNGFEKATEIVFGHKDVVLSHVRPGYRKNTTGEYVPKKYLTNFGWKNTYYCHAETVVQICP